MDTLNNGVVVAASCKVFGLQPLKNVSADYVAPAGMRECRIIVKSNAAGNEGKISQFCTLPEVTDAKVALFASLPKGQDLIRGFIETLENAVARRCYAELGRSPCETDFEVEELFSIGALQSQTVRITKETVGAWFESKKNSIAHFLAVTKHGEEMVRTAEFWGTANGERMLEIAANYKSYFLDLAGRAPSYMPGVQAKLERVAAAVMEGTTLEEKMLEKLTNAVERSAADLGLE